MPEGPSRERKLREQEILDWFASDTRARGPRAVVLVAHPDDETIGLGARLAELDPCALVVVTDGAPAAVFADPQAQREQAALRDRELGQALAAGGVRAEALRRWQVPDQQAAFMLPELGERALALFRELEPEVVLTHAYEGGHPDHDATAFAVQWAARAMTGGGPVLLEMPYYHGAANGQVWGRFAGDPGHARLLRGEPLARKRAMLAAYRSQADVLARVPLDAERVRVAGPHDFAAAPPVRDFLYPVVAPSVTAAAFLNRARCAWRA